MMSYFFFNHCRRFYKGRIVVSVTTVKWFVNVHNYLYFSILTQFHIMYPRLCNLSVLGKLGQRGPPHSMAHPMRWQGDSLIMITFQEHCGSTGSIAKTYWTEDRVKPKQVFNGKEKEDKKSHSSVCPQGVLLVLCKR